MLRSLARRFVLTPNTIRYRIEYRILVDLISSIPGKTLGEVVLDAGAGSGEMGIKLQNAGMCGKLVGVEPFDANFNILRQNYGQSPNRVCHHAGLEKIPLDSASVDGVISTQVFEHILDDKTAAAEVSRVLKPGGYAIISTPHPPEVFPNDGHMRPGYTVEEMQALFAPVGFSLVSHRYFFVSATVRRVIAATELGKLGMLLPLGWADREAHLTQAEMKAGHPYGIACLFRKNPPL